MKFSLSFLKKALSFSETASISEIEDIITSSGLEVEEIFSPALKYRNFIIAKIEECEKHPESSKLNLCKVNTGNEILDVVCGASNARKGIKVVFAKIGAIVPENGMEIKKTAIRGKESNGMICSASELCLEKGFEPLDGIIELPESAVIGMNFADFANLNDEIFHISITPNRGDACSVLGVARDLSAKNFSKLKNIFKPSSAKFSNLTSVEIANDVKPLMGETVFTKFSASSFEGISEELQIYNKVYGTSGVQMPDFANYLMFLTGAPMHVYDASKIEGKIFVRRSINGETLVPIKGEEIKLPEGLLVVADETKILSLLGVMGDARSKVEATTTNFILEVLSVSALEVLKSSRITGVKSDSSYRFERGVDFLIQKKVTELFLESLNIKTAEMFFFEGSLKKKKIEFQISDYSKRIGTEIETSKMKQILTDLGFEILSEKEGSLELLIPSFKQDISISADIVEEVARISGYENIKPLELQSLKPVSNYDLNFEIKKVLSEEMQEVITYSFFKEKYFGMFSSSKNKISLKNPITEDLTTMRDSLIPNLLENIAISESKNYNTSKIFEVGTVFYGTSEFDQKTNIAVAFSGNANEKNFLKQEEKFTIWHAKNKMLEVLFRNFGLQESSINFEAITNSNLHTHQSFGVYLGKNLIGILAGIHPLTLDAFEIKERVFCFELYLEKLPLKKQKAKSYKEDLLPNVIREIAIILPIETKFEHIRNSISSLRLANLKEIFVKDVFTSPERIGKDLKSISLQFVINQETKTLVKEEIDRIVESITAILAQKFNAKLRDGETAK